MVTIYCCDLPAHEYQIIVSWLICLKTFNSCKPRWIICHRVSKCDFSVATPDQYVYWGLQSFSVPALFLHNAELLKYISQVSQIFRTSLFIDHWSRQSTSNTVDWCLKEERKKKKKKKSLQKDLRCSIVALLGHIVILCPSSVWKGFSRSETEILQIRCITVHLLEH